MCWRCGEGPLIQASDTDPPLAPSLAPERTIMRTMKTRSGREPANDRTWRAVRVRDRIPAARDGHDAPAEHGAPAEQDAGHAVAALYQLHYPALVRLAALLVPDLATAEDIVQDA